jgi:hypothetical protein
MECLLVVAHAMGRTLVIPPQQHLYLLGQSHKDAGDKIAHDEMGFEDFFNIDVLGSHKGLHVLPMKELLVKEALTGNSADYFKILNLIPNTFEVDFMEYFLLVIQVMFGARNFGLT